MRTLLDRRCGLRLRLRSEARLQSLIMAEKTSGTKLRNRQSRSIFCILRCRKMRQRGVLRSYGDLSDFSSTAHQQPPKPKQHQARLSPHHLPKQARRFVAINLSERLTSRAIQQIHQMRIVFLLEVMQCPANEPVRAEFPSEGREFAAVAIAQDGFGHPERAAEAGHNAADGRNFHLCRSVPNQENLSIADTATNRNPLLVNGNARALPLKWLHIFLLQKAFDAALGVAAVLADNAQRTALRRLRN